MFVARIKDNPVAFTINVNVAATNLLRMNEIKQCRGFNLNFYPFYIRYGQSQVRGAAYDCEV